MQDTLYSKFLLPVITLHVLDRLGISLYNAVIIWGILDVYAYLG